jgi:hypothetical protein
MAVGVRWLKRSAQMMLTTTASGLASDTPSKTPTVKSSDDLLARCEELLDILYAHPEHAKLRMLVADIESLRDRLLGEAEVDTDSDVQQR